MSSNTTTTKLVTLDKSKELVTIFSGMQSLSSFDDCLDKLDKLLTAMSQIEDIPSNMDGFTLEQIHQAAEMVRYFCIVVPQEGDIE